MIRTFVIAAAIGALAIGAAPVASAAPYKNCTAAAQDGRYNIPSDDPAYGEWLDRDLDGIGCEKTN
jgi:Excalibur calcium-binding domain